MSSNGSVIQGFFIGNAPRPAPRVPGAPQAAQPVVQRFAGHSSNDVIPVEPGRLNLSSSIGRPLPANVQRKM
jgi:hypothetical protein